MIWPETPSTLELPMLALYRVAPLHPPRPSPKRWSGVLASTLRNGTSVELAGTTTSQFDEDAVLGVTPRLPPTPRLKPSTTCPLRSDSSGGDLLPEPPQLATNLQRCVCGDRGFCTAEIHISARLVNLFHGTPRWARASISVSKLCNARPDTCHSFTQRL